MPIQAHAAQFLNFIRDISLKASKDGTILMNFLQLKFGSITCLSISRSLKQPAKVSVQWRSQEYLFRKVSAN